MLLVFKLLLGPICLSLLFLTHGVAGKNKFSTVDRCEVTNDQSTGNWFVGPKGHHVLRVSHDSIATLQLELSDDRGDIVPSCVCYVKIGTHLHCGGRPMLRLSRTVADVDVKGSKTLYGTPSTVQVEATNHVYLLSGNNVSMSKQDEVIQFHPRWFCRMRRAWFPFASPFNIQRVEISEVLESVANEKQYSVDEEEVFVT